MNINYSLYIQNTTTKQIYGELPHGLMVRMSILKAKSMLKPDCAILNALGKHFNYEVAVGMNGVVWLRGENPVQMIVIRNALLNSEHLSSDVQITAMVDKLATLAKKLV